MSRATDNHDMAYFGAPETSTVVTRTLGRGVVSFNRLRAETPLGVTDNSVVEDAIMVAYQHRAVLCDVFLENRHVAFPGESQDRVTLYDYRDRWNCEIKTAYEATNIHVPRAVLDEVLQESGSRSGDILLKPGNSVDDLVVRGFVLTLAKAFREPDRPNTLFLDHVGWAFAAYCAASFLENEIAAPAGGRLAPWQERLSKEMIEERLDGDLRLADLARACGLSVSHYARAFRKTTRVSPHQWLIARRIERARDLLLTTDRPISEVALDCGFHDQSHFTHTFTGRVGGSPAAWRRTRRA